MVFLIALLLQDAVTQGLLGGGAPSGPSSFPVAVGSRLLVKNVSFAHGWAYATTCLLLTDGKVAYAGNQDNAKRALGQMGISNVPFFHTLPLVNATHLVGSPYGFCAVSALSLSSNRLYCWG